MLRSRLQTNVCLRLMEGADVYQLAKNCCTSVEMIEKRYAAPIKNMLDGGLILMLEKSKKHQKVSKMPMRICKNRGQLSS